jgi:hypothetical protein
MRRLIKKVWWACAALNLVGIVLFNIYIFEQGTASHPGSSREVIEAGRIEFLRTLNESQAKEATLGVELLNESIAKQATLGVELLNESLAKEDTHGVELLNESLAKEAILGVELEPELTAEEVKKLRLFDASACVWKPTRDIIRGVKNSTLARIIKAKTKIITYGTADWQPSKIRACKEAKHQAAVDECIAMGPESLDKTFADRFQEILQTPRGGGLWLWKPYIINKTLANMDYGDYLIYHDAGSYFRGPVQPLIALMESGYHSPPLDGVLTFGVGLDQSMYCKRDAFILQKCDDEKCHQAMQVDGFLSIWRKGPHALRVVNMWLEECKDLRILGDGPSKLAPNLKGFKAHRHDQAILTNILTREGWGRDTENGPAKFMMRHDRNKQGQIRG